MDRLIGVQWGEVCVNLAIVLSNVEAVSIHILTVVRCDRQVRREKSLLHGNWYSVKLVLKCVCTHLSLGSRPSLVYCQQMSPMRS